MSCSVVIIHFNTKISKHNIMTQNLVCKGISRCGDLWRDLQTRNIFPFSLLKKSYFRRKKNWKSEKSVSFTNGLSESGNPRTMQILPDHSYWPFLGRMHQCGYCKFGGNCRKHHINDLCTNENCTSSSCQRRQSRVFKVFSQWNVWHL